MLSLADVLSGATGHAGPHSPESVEIEGSKGPEIELLFSQALEIMRTCLGPNHAEVLAVVQRYALVLYSLAKYDQAVKLFRELLKQHEHHEAASSPNQPATHSATHGVAPLASQRSVTPPRRRNSDPGTLTRTLLIV